MYIYIYIISIFQRQGCFLCLQPFRLWHIQFPFHSNTLFTLRIKKNIIDKQHSLYNQLFFVYIADHYIMPFANIFHLSIIQTISHRIIYHIIRYADNSISAYIHKSTYYKIALIASKHHLHDHVIPQVTQGQMQTQSLDSECNIYSFYSTAPACSHWE